MSWKYVSIDEANQIMRRHSPFDDVRPRGVRFPGSAVWNDVTRLANNAIMCAHEHEGFQPEPEWRLKGLKQLLTGQEP